MQEESAAALQPLLIYLEALQAALPFWRSGLAMLVASNLARCFLAAIATRLPYTATCRPSYMCPLLVASPMLRPLGAIALASIRGIHIATLSRMFVSAISTTFTNSQPPTHCASSGTYESSNHSNIVSGTLRIVMESCRNSTIPCCIPPHWSHILQTPSVSCFGLRRKENSRQAELIIRAYCYLHYCWSLDV
jgi:hypothetical protein